MDGYDLHISAVPALPPGTPCGDLLSLTQDDAVTLIDPAQDSAVSFAAGDSVSTEMDLQIMELVNANPGHVFTLTLTRAGTDVVYHTQIIEPTK
ncbi:hypothetical protein ABZ470_39970 [Streptosporangium sp. NPDC020072]|uniref:hypothetical protein n=1 Tax=Streptosporangium sp. NPDC020072 TaxID=3154788 RepID=UPI003427F768